MTPLPKTHCLRIPCGRYRSGNLSLPQCASSVLELTGEAGALTSFRKPLPDRKLPAGGRPKGTQLLEPIAPSKARTRLWLNSVRRTRSPTPCVANHEEDRGLSLAYEVRSAGVSSLREPRATLCSWKPASPYEVRALLCAERILKEFHSLPSKSYATVGPGK
jgi:hypothetical protein